LSGCVKDRRYNVHVDPSLLGLTLFVQSKAERSNRATILRRWREASFIVLVGSSLVIGMSGNWGKTVDPHESTTPARGDCLFVPASSSGLLATDQIIGVEFSTRSTCSALPVTQK
jgi:hypothetical protein